MGAVATPPTPDRVRAMTAGGYWRNETLEQLLDRWATRQPEKTAIVDGTGRYTYGELIRTVERVAHGLRALGVGRDSVISCQLPNWNEFVLVALAASRLGAILNPLYGRCHVGGRPLLDRCGKWLFLPRGCVSAAEARLACVGPLAFFIGRVIPFLRICQFRGCRPHSAARARGPAMRAPGLAGLGVGIPPAGRGARQEPGLDDQELGRPARSRGVRGLRSPGPRRECNHPPSPERQDASCVS